MLLLYVVYKALNLTMSKLASVLSIFDQDCINYLSLFYNL